MTSLLDPHTGLHHHIYGDDGSDKNTLPRKLITLALTINTIALILSMSVIVVVVTLTMSLVTEYKQHELPSKGQELRTNFQMTTSMSESSSSEGTQEDSETDSLPKDAFLEILGLCPLIVLSSLIGVYAARKSSSTGVIVVYWVILTGSLLISTYVTSKFVEYEELFDWKEKEESSRPIEVVSRLIVLIGSLQMISAVMVTVAKFQKKRVAVKDPSLPDFSSILLANTSRLNQPHLGDHDQPQLPNSSSLSLRQHQVNLVVNQASDVALDSRRSLFVDERPLR